MKELNMKSKIFQSKISKFHHWYFVLFDIELLHMFHPHQIYKRIFKLFHQMNNTKWLNYYNDNHYLLYHHQHSIWIPVRGFQWILCIIGPIEIMICLCLFNRFCIYFFNNHKYKSFCEILLRNSLNISSAWVIFIALTIQSFYRSSNSVFQFLSYRNNSFRLFKLTQL
jgi:hypothetical protein